MYISNRLATNTLMPCSHRGRHRESKAKLGDVRTAYLFGFLHFHYSCHIWGATFQETLNISYRRDTTRLVTECQSRSPAISILHLSRISVESSLFQYSSYLILIFAPTWMPLLFLRRQFPSYSTLSYFSRLYNTMSVLSWGFEVVKL